MSKTISLRLSDKEYTRIQQMLAINGMKLSEYIRMVILEDLEENMGFSEEYVQEILQASKDSQEGNTVSCEDTLKYIWKQ